MIRILTGIGFGWIMGFLTMTSDKKLVDCHEWRNKIMWRGRIPHHSNPVKEGNPVAAKASRAAPPTTKLETITPERAQALLATNTTNRKFKQKHAANLAREIQSGRWMVNGDSIKISTDNILLDGQHRLAAIIISNKPIPTMVTYGLNPQVFGTIDTAAVKRNNADLIGLAGYANSARLAAGVSLLWRLITEAAWNDVMPAGSVVEVLERYPSAAHWASRFAGSQAISSFLTAGNFIAACVYLSEIAGRYDLVERLADGLHTGENLTSGDPILALRNRMIAEKSRMRGLHQSSRDNWPILVKVLDALEAGKSLTTFQVQRARSGPVRPKKFETHARVQSPSRMLTDLPPSEVSGLTVAQVEKMGPTRFTH